MSKSVHFRFPEDILERLRIESNKGGITITEMVLIAVRRYFEQLYDVGIEDSEPIRKYGVKKSLPGKLEVVEMGGEAPPVVCRAVPESSDEVPKILPGLIAKKVASGGYFNPMPKVLKNAGKGK